MGASAPLQLSPGMPHPEHHRERLPEGAEPQGHGKGGYSHLLPEALFLSLKYGFLQSPQNTHMTTQSQIKIVPSLSAVSGH